MLPTSGGAGGNQGGRNDSGGSAGAPDTRPPRPAWEPPIPLGSVGWHGSSEPFCPPQQGGQVAFGVWADAAAVHAVFGTFCDSFSQGVCNGPQGSSLWRNEGTGWQVELDFGASETVGLSGFPGGPVLVGVALEGKPGIYRVEQGKLKLSHALDGLSGLQLFGAGPEHAYAQYDSEVLEYRDGSWSSLGKLPAQILSISGGDQLALAVGTNQSIYLKTGGAAFKPLPDVPAGDYTASWAFDENDIWVGNGVGQLLHYDGTAWRVVETGSRDTTGSGIVAMWGDADTVYFMTFTEFGRATAAGAELLFSRSPSAKPSDPYFSPQSLWGKSKTEVFLTISDAAFADYACGAAFIVWFDGREFHQF